MEIYTKDNWPGETWIIIEKILKELLEGEFKDLKHKKICLIKKISDRNAWASIWVNKVGEIELKLFPKNEKGMFFEKILKGILRHELLHVLVGQLYGESEPLDDRDPRFKAEAKLRKIDVWTLT